MAQTYPSVEAVPAVIENYLGIPGLELGGKFIVDILQCKFDEEIKPYDRPVLVIHGTADALVPLSYGEKASASYNHSRLLVVPEAEHGFQVDETTVNNVVEFLNN
jgi:pimeloyl-ACP methyl ester carboxylesterase